MTALSFACNTNNDLYLDARGNIAIAQDILAILQICENVAKSLLGEMVLNTDQGMPYFQTVWNGVPNIAQFEAALRSAFRAVPGVINVVSLITGIVGTTLNYSAIIQTSFGNGAING